MSIKFVNEWKKNPYGKSSTVFLIGWMDLAGMPPYLSIVVLGIGVSFIGRKKS